MKKYNKPSLELLEVSVKENIAALPGVTYDSENAVTTYTLNTYHAANTVS